MPDTVDTFTDVVAQEGVKVGDDNQPEVRKPQVAQRTASEAAQVAPPRAAEATEVKVHETAVSLDEVITDPSSPLAVQVPDAGRGSLDLPIHALAGKTPEEKLADGDADREVNEGDGDTREGVSSRAEFA